MERLTVMDPQRFFVLIVCSVGHGCSDGAAETAATDIVLSPERGLNSTGQLLSKVDRIQIILDREPELYPPCAPGETCPITHGDGIEIRNVDMDPGRELTRNITIAGWDHLPAIRVRSGPFEGETIDIRVVGILSFGDQAAFGEQVGLTMPISGQGVFRELVRFNLTDANLPPRVMSTAIVGDCAAPRGRVVFSRDVDPSSFDRRILVGCNECELYPSPTIIGSVAEWEIPALVGVGTIRSVSIVVRTGILAADAERTPFDQLPDDSAEYAGPNGYRDDEVPFTLCRPTS